LEKAGFKVESVAALMGDRRLVVDRKTIKRLDQALKTNGYEFSASAVANSLSRAEVGCVIVNINNARSNNAKKGLSEKLQGLLDRGNPDYLGRDQGPGRYESERGINKGNESISEGVRAWRVSGSRTAGKKMTCVEKLRLRRENQKIKNLARYIIRASFSQERMIYQREKGQVAYRSKDGLQTKVFDALEWLAAMCSHVPNRGEQLARYYGYYSNVARGKRKKPGVMIKSHVSWNTQPKLKHRLILILTSSDCI
jgi:hypothetical protein